MNAPGVPSSLLVGVSLAWGVAITLANTVKLFS